MFVKIALFLLSVLLLASGIMALMTRAPKVKKLSGLVSLWERGLFVAS